ncbi:MAG: type II secretion system protein GspK [Nannocystaceae bacterium]
MDDEAQTEQRRGEGPGFAERGVALLLVIACLAVLMPMTASYSYTTRVDWQAAINLRDEVAARNLERGALRMSLLLFELQRQVFSQKQFRDYMGTMDITQVAPYLMGVFGSDTATEELEGLAALAGLDNINADAFKDLALTTGTFQVNLEAESGKVNVNCLADTTEKNKGDTPQARVVEVLDAMLLPTLYDPLFQEEREDGQRYSRIDVVQAIADYIDDDDKRFDMISLSASSRPESYGYTQLFDPYEQRNARLDSVEELALVKGVNDDVMMILAPDVTVYGGCKVNLNFASAEQIALVIRHAVSAADKWKTEGDKFLLMTLPLARYVVEIRTFSLFKDLEAFKEFVRKPDQFINPLALGATDAGERDPNLPKIPEGIDVRVEPSKPDSKDVWGGLSEIATVAPERVYRIEVIVEVGSVKKRVTAVYDMQFQRSQSTGKGAWLYFRED